LHKCAANGVVQIISNNNFEVDIHRLIDRSFELVKSKLDKPENNKDVVYDFFKQRVNWLLKQRNIDYDIIDSVMHIDHSNIPELINRAEALQELKKQKDFIKLVLGFKRVSNIISEIKDIGNVDEKLLTEESEIQLNAEFIKLSTIINNYLLLKDYDKALNEFILFGASIDKFFDDVMVNVDDKKIRNNRYYLLSNIRTLFLNVADLNRIVVDG